MGPCLHRTAKSLLFRQLASDVVSPRDCTNLAGLHSRPYSAEVLQQYFPVNTLNLEYSPTYYPSRRGENIRELEHRIQVFTRAFIKRIEAEYPDVKTISIISHAATVIKLGQTVSVLLRNIQVPAIGTHMPRSCSSLPTHSYARAQLRRRNMRRTPRRAVGNRNGMAMPRT